MLAHGSLGGVVGRITFGMLDPTDQIRFRKGGDRSVGAAAGSKVGDLGDERCGNDLVVLAADFNLCV